MNQQPRVRHLFMLSKILATLQKEWLLLRRDVGGILVLLLMPAVLIVVMAMVQDAPFRDYQEIRFDLLAADADQSTLSTELLNGLEKSGHFNITRLPAADIPDTTQLKTMLRRGNAHVGILIPKGAEAELNNAANKVANQLAGATMGGGRLPSREARNLHISVYFDPASRPTLRSAVYFALDKFIAYANTQQLVRRLTRLSGDTTLAASDSMLQQTFSALSVQIAGLDTKGSEAGSISSVQHNVPAWAIFGMFFIVVPITSHQIREREEGSAMRLELIPYAHLSVALGKVLFFMMVCTLQFYIMCGVGVWLMPLLGLAALQMGAHPEALLLLVLAIAFCATSYGYFLGAYFKTVNQAMPFGALSVVILAAIGGTWVPVELLPDAVQYTAMISPLHWGLSGANQLMLRGGGLSEIWVQLLMLLALGSTLVLLGLWKNRHRSISV